MPDQKLAAPYGDIVFVNTPNLDRMGATLLAEQQRKDAAEKKTNDLLDVQFAKELGGVRSTDVPDLTSKYAQMKLLKQGTYNKKLKDADRIALQQKAIGATADTYQTINQSKEIKNTLAAIQADQKKNPNDYSPEYTNLMQTALSLPTAKLKEYNTGKKDANGQPIVLDLTNPDTYAYQLGSTDFTPALKEAMGDIKQKRGNTLSIDTPDKMGTINVEYTGINSPDQYLSNLQHSVVGSKKTSDFIKEAQPLIADEANIINSFDELTKTEAFKNAYPDFKGFNPMLMNTELGKAMILSAMKAHIISPPREVKSNPIPKWKKREDYKHGQKVGDIYLQDRLIRARAKYNKTATDNGITINDVYDKLVQNQNAADINTTDEKGNKVKAARFNALPNDAQNIVMASLKEINPDVAFDNVYQIQEPDGSIGIYITDENDQPKPSIKTRLTTISRTGVNLKAQPNVKGKVEVIKQGEKNKPTGTNGWKSRAKKIK